MNQRNSKSATAVLLIDDNNDFFSERGALYGAIANTIKENGTVENICGLLFNARQKGVPVIRLPMAFSHDYREMGSSPYGIFKTIRDSRALIAGSWGASSADNLTYAESDTILKGKCAASAFHKTDLNERLSIMGISTIVLAGVLSNICIEATMRAAYDLGYSVIVAEDCVAALSNAEHQASRDSNWPYFAYTMTSQTLFRIPQPT